MLERVITGGIVLAAAVGLAWGVYRSVRGGRRCAGCTGCGKPPSFGPPARDR